MKIAEVVAIGLLGEPYASEVGQEREVPRLIAKGTSSELSIALWMMENTTINQTKRNSHG